MKFHSGQWLAVSIVGVVGLWLTYGSLSAEQLVAPESILSQQDSDLSRVLVRQSLAEPISEQLILTGNTKANRQVSLNAESSGRVVSLSKSKGASVAANEVIARLDSRDTEAQLRSARSMVEQRQQELEATRSLVSRNLQNQTQLTVAQAAYDQALAQRTSLEISLSNSSIRAPFAGLLNELDIELGSFVSPGQVIGTVLDFDPLVVLVDVPEADIDRIRIGTQARIDLLTGRQNLAGEVTFISAAAKASTRTFAVELALLDPDLPQSTGLTARVSFELPTQPAHFISPALLQLSEDGKLGIKTLDEQDRVQFSLVNLIRTQTDGVWLGGLGEDIRVITRGQGFVSPGESVIAVQE